MRKIVKTLFYNVICPAILGVGVDKLLRKFSKNRSLIIMYHGMSRQKRFDINGRHLPVEQFERQLLYFRKNFDIVSLEEICEMKSKGRRGQKHTVALTFDDGFLNIVQTALPLLQQYNIPATIFICGIGLLDKSYLHPSDLVDLVRISSGDTVEIGGSTFVNTRNRLIHRESGLDGYTYVTSLRLADWMNFFASLKTAAHRSNIISETDSESYELISGEVVRQLDSYPLIGIGSHSYHHISLASLTPGEIKDQLILSKRTLEGYLSKSIQAFAFPYGNFNHDVVSLAQEAGYKYLIGAGDVETKFETSVFPRIGILNGASFSFNILSLNKGFGKFGF